MHRLEFIEEDAPARAQGGLPVAEHVPGSADSRSDKVVVPLEHGITERGRARDANEAIHRLWTPVGNPSVDFVRHRQQLVAHTQIQRERPTDLVVVLNIGVKEDVLITLVGVGAPADRCNGARRARVHAGKGRRQSLQEALQRREGECTDLRGGEIDVVSNFLQDASYGEGMRPTLEEELIGELELVAAIVASAGLGTEAASAWPDAETRKRQSCTGGAAGSRCR